MNVRNKIVFFLFFITFTSTFSLFGKTTILTTPTGGNFSFTSSTSDQFHLSDLKGKTTFLFFGYTNCPTVCPLTVQRLKKLHDHLEGLSVNDVRFLFVSVDFERDTIQALKAYAKNKGKNFIAAISDEKKLREIISQYGGHFSKIKTKSGRVIIDHSTDVYVINQYGEWIKSIPYDRPFADYLQAYVESKQARYKNVKESREVAIIMSPECELSKSSCEFTLPDLSKGSISFSTLPIKTEKEFSVEVKSDSKKFTPVEIDFVGVDQNMGLIRPSLSSSQNNIFLTKLKLPICEVEKMNWKARLIFKDLLSKHYLIEFKFLTVD